MEELEAQGITITNNIQQMHDAAQAFVTDRLTLHQISELYRYQAPRYYIEDCYPDVNYWSYRGPEMQLRDKVHNVSSLFHHLHIHQPTSVAIGAAVKANNISISELITFIGKVMNKQASVTTRLVCALELLANSHILERMSEPLKACYAKLRTSFPNAQLELQPDADQIKISFARQDGKLRTSTVFAEACVSMVRNGNKMRVKGTSESCGPLNKLCVKPRDAVYHLESWVDV